MAAESKQKPGAGHLGVRLMAAHSETELLREEAETIVRGALAAAKELMTEYVSKRRAADWCIINDGLYNAEKFLRAISLSKRGSHAR